MASILNARFRLTLIVSLAALLAIFYTVRVFPIFSLVPLSIAAQFAVSTQYDGYHSLYSFDTSHSHAPRWMTDLPSGSNLTSLSIPGTHDTMTSAVNGPTFQCQNHPLDTQLEAGIRYFDIRARLQNNELQIYHQDSYTQQSYADVLTTMFEFLDSNPGETILMRLKEESTPINSTINFLTAFNFYRLNSSITASGCSRHFWVPPTPGLTSVPTLGELRNKILILQNFGSEPAEYGIKWESSLLNIEDYWIVPDLKGLDEKWSAIQENLEAANNGTEKQDGILYLSHLSASVGVLPIEAAAGNKNGSVVGVNDRTGEWLKNGNGGKTGVVIIDFPGQKLVQGILKRNHG